MRWITNMGERRKSIIMARKLSGAKSWNCSLPFVERMYANEPEWVGVQCPCKHNIMLVEYVLICMLSLSHSLIRVHNAGSMTLIRLLFIAHLRISSHAQKLQSRKNAFLLFSLFFFCNREEVERGMHQNYFMLPFFSARIRMLCGHSPFSLDRRKSKRM